MQRSEAEHQQERRKVQDLTQVFKILKGIEPEQIFGRRRENQYMRQSANPWNLTKKQATDPRLHSFGLRVVEEWNALPKHFKSLEKVHGFQTQLRQE
jgi:hypothetical protein